MWPAASTSRRVDPTWWQAPPAGITNQGSILARAQKTRSERRLRLRVVDRHDQLAGLDLRGQGLDPGLGLGGTLFVEIVAGRQRGAAATHHRTFPVVSCITRTTPQLNHGGVVCRA